jgi:adenylosuccinate synthase
VKIVALLTRALPDLNILGKAELEDKTMQGWQTPVRGHKMFNSLPLQAQEYVE